MFLKGVPKILFEQIKKYIGIKSQDTNIINEHTKSKNVIVWIKFRQYKISIYYKLLSELGEISHFILSVMNEHDVTKENIELITGFNKQQLLPILTRLKGLGLLNDKNKITPKGEIIAYILEHIHKKTINVAIDRHYHNKKLDVLLIPADSSVLQNIPSDAIIMPELKTIRKNSKEDCFSQIERIQRLCENILPKLFPKLEKILPDLKKKHWELEWDIKVLSSDNSKGLHKKVELQSYESSTNQYPSNEFTLYTPLLILKTEFKQPNGFNWEDSIAVPKPLLAVYSINDDAIYYQDLSVSIPKESITYTKHKIDSQQAHTLIKKTLKKMEEEHKLFSYQYDFKKAWQQYQSFNSYENLINSFNHKDIIRVKQA